MKPNKISLILVICLYIAIKSVYAQNDYFATDSSIFAGASIVNGGYENGKRVISVSTSTGTFRFSAEDIKEYGLEDGRVFFSKEIDLLGNKQQVFLELLFNGEHKLYQYSTGKNRRFFIEKKNSFFTELLKENHQYRAQLNAIFSSNPQVSESVKLLKFKKNFLIKLLDNLSKKLSRPIPHTKIVLSTIFNQTSLHVPDHINNIYLNGSSFAKNKSFGLGLFIDTPIEMSNLTLNAGLTYQKSSFSLNSRKDSTETDIAIDISSLDIPLMLRFTIPRFRWMPFINLGGNFMLHIQNSNEIYVSEINENTVTIDKIEGLKLLNKTMLGVSIGTGVQYRLNYRNYISSEIRYSRFFSTKHYLGVDRIQLIVSFSF